MVGNPLPTSYLSDLPKVIQMDRRGHVMQGMDATYIHVTDEMRQRLCDYLEQLWHKGIAERHALAPRSAVPILDDILIAHEKNLQAEPQPTAQSERTPAAGRTDAAQVPDVLTSTTTASPARPFPRLTDPIVPSLQADAISVNPPFILSTWRRVSATRMSVFIAAWDLRRAVLNSAHWRPSRTGETRSNVVTKSDSRRSYSMRYPPFGAAARLTRSTFRAAPEWSFCAGSHLRARSTRSSAGWGQPERDDPLRTAGSRYGQRDHIICRRDSCALNAQRARCETHLVASR
jgi:hypothetical protein